MVKRIEARTRNRYARILTRTFMNPACSFANVMDWRMPWYRDSRTGVSTYTPTASMADRAAPAETWPVRAVSLFEFTATTSVRQAGETGCIGGGAEGAYRAAPDWQIVLDVNGCKMIGLAENVSGDALVYQAGPRWTPSPGGKWSPFAHLLVGGIKLTQERLDPTEKQRALEAHQDPDPMPSYTLHGKYTSEKDSSGLAVTAGIIGSIRHWRFASRVSSTCAVAAGRAAGFK